ncbi:hypothetical protein D3C84_1067090 [compost metagenome]
MASEVLVLVKSEVFTVTLRFHELFCCVAFEIDIVPDNEILFLKICFFPDCTGFPKPKLMLFPNPVQLYTVMLPVLLF